MAGDDLILGINQHWIRKAEDADALGNLADLVLRVCPGISRMGVETLKWFEVNL